MSVTIGYRGYKAKLEWVGDHWCGKIEGISDLITVCADRVGAVREEAIAAIDDYIETCAELGVEPNQPAENAK